MVLWNRFVVLACLAALTATGLAVAPRSAPAQVLLNEILADPARDWDGDGVYQYRDDEWVEIVNAGSSAVSLEGYRLAGADTTWRYEFSGTLDPGAVRVVYGSQSYAWEKENGAPQYGLRLANGGGEIGLWRLGASDTVRVDTYVYRDFEAEDDRSTGRFPDGASEWRLYDALNPYEGTEPPLGTNCLPSPGERVSCPLPQRASTWGRVKRMY